LERGAIKLTANNFVFIAADAFLCIGAVLEWNTLLLSLCSERCKPEMMSLVQVLILKTSARELATMQV
jgi:hypothetical protein